MGFVSNIIRNLNQSLKNARGIYTSDQRQKMLERMAKDKDITVDKMFSERHYDIGHKPAEWHEDNIGRSAPGDTLAANKQISSTAIDSVKYSPSTEECKVKYKNGDKWYNFVNMSPEQFETYMTAGSKGRYTQQMRQTNHDPRYPRTI